MNDSSRYQQEPVQGSYPQQGKAQPPRAAEADAAPDFMQLAAMQLRQVITGIDTRARVLQETSPGESAEWDPGVRAARIEVADRLIALAQIQYDIPPDDDDEDDDYARR